MLNKFKKKQKGSAIIELLISNMVMLTAILAAMIIMLAFLKLSYVNRDINIAKEIIQSVQAKYDTYDKVTVAYPTPANTFPITEASNKPSLYIPNITNIDPTLDNRMSVVLSITKDGNFNYTQATITSFTPPTSSSPISNSISRFKVKVTVFSGIRQSNGNFSIGNQRKLLADQEVIVTQIPAIANPS